MLAPLVDALERGARRHRLRPRRRHAAGVVLRRLLAAGQTVAVAESLTGGLLGAALTELPGSSAAFRGGLLVYATDAQGELAGVPERGARRSTARCRPQTAQALAEGVRDRLGATWGVGVTGVAGPDEQEGKPAGTVHVAVAGPDGVRSAQRAAARRPRSACACSPSPRRSTCCAGSSGGLRGAAEQADAGERCVHGRSAVGGHGACAAGAAARPTGRLDVLTRRC